MSNITTTGDIMSAKLWTEKFDNQQANIYKLPPHPQNHVLFFESTLCLSSNMPKKTATPQQYPLSTEIYSDSETVRETWQPDVGVYFGVGCSQEDGA
jgi:hypothetical protein